MTVSSLPPELWHEILSYLPPATIRKLIGLNRVLFDLALNSIYEEIRFVCNDEDTINMFSKLVRNHDISIRVRQLLVNPSFLPGLDEEYEEDPMEGILDVATKAIRMCTNIREITLILYDLALTPMFVQFLESMWSSGSLCHTLTTLTIKTTAAKVPFFLKPFTDHTDGMTRLASFNIMISSSRTRNSRDWDEAIDALANFLRAFSRSIKKFTFSALVEANVDKLFSVLPVLLNLRAFEFLSVFNTTCFPTSKYLTRFIEKHAPTLRELIIKPRVHPASRVFNTSDKRYSVWLADSKTVKMEGKGPHRLTEIVLPSLRTMDIGLLSTWEEYMDVKVLNVLPNLPRLAPGLTTLILTDTVKLSAFSIVSLLDLLSGREGGSSIESIAFVAYTIFPQLFDDLAHNFSRLKSISIDYLGYGLSIKENGKGTRFSAGDPDAFLEVMAKRRYESHRAIEYLRLAAPSYCGTPHPHPRVMKVISQALSDADIVLGMELTCQCRPAVDSYLYWDWA